MKDFNSSTFSDIIEYQSHHSAPYNLVKARITRNRSNSRRAGSISWCDVATGHIAAASAFFAGFVAFYACDTKDKAHWGIDCFFQKSAQMWFFLLELVKNNLLKKPNRKRSLRASSCHTNQFYENA